MPETGRAGERTGSVTLIRNAIFEEVGSLQRLIERSARALARGFYTAEQIEGALGSAWGIDSLLIEDGTYFVAEHQGAVAGCGGWSPRATLFGSDALSARTPELLNPAHDAARIRAFFVAPEFARRGVAKSLLYRCEQALLAQGFGAAELVATLPGVPFYAAFGFVEFERILHPLPNGLSIEFVRMRKQYDQASNSFTT